MSITPELAADIAKNFPVMLNNFKKIGAWLTKGETEASPFPPAVKIAHDKLTQVIKDVTALSSSQTATNKQLTGLEKEIAALKKSYAELEESYTELDERLNNLDEPAALAEPKPKTRAKTKPKVDPVPEVVEPTELEATAAAIGAGELSVGALQEVDDLLDAL